MRIAISGTHRTGKTTLVEQLHRALPAYAAVGEPYWQMVEEGHAFGALPSLDDFELQLERAVQLLEEADDNTLFDRCPADLLAYLLTHHDADQFELEDWLPRSQAAMQRLDLLVFVPIEDPDRIPVDDTDDEDLRLRVDEELRDIVVADRWGFATETVEVLGDTSERLHQVLRCVAPTRT